MSDDDGLRKRFNRLQLEAARTITDDARLSTAARTVGVKLNTLVNFERRYAWPKQETLTGELGIPKRTMIRAIQQLVAHGYFRRWRFGRKNRYVPCWLERMGDAFSRAALVAADPPPARRNPELSVVCGRKGANLAPIGENPCGKAAIGATVAPIPPRKGATVAPLSESIEDSYGARAVENPAHPRPPAGEKSAGGPSAQELPDEQRELPLVRSLPENPYAAENAAHQRLDSGIVDAVGPEQYGQVIGWLPPDVLGRAVEAEIAEKGQGVALIVREWFARGDPKVAEGGSGAGAGGSAGKPLKRAGGAA